MCGGPGHLPPDCLFVGWYQLCTAIVGVWVGIRVVVSWPCWAKRPSASPHNTGLPPVSTHPPTHPATTRFPPSPPTHPPTLPSDCGPAGPGCLQPRGAGPGPQNGGPGVPQNHQGGCTAAPVIHLFIQSVSHFAAPQQPAVPLMRCPSIWKRAAFWLLQATKPLPWTPAAPVLCLNCSAASRCLHSAHTAQFTAPNVCTAEQPGLLWPGAGQLLQYPTCTAPTLPANHCLYCRTTRTTLTRAWMK